MRKSVKWTLIVGAPVVALAAGLGLWSHTIGVNAGRCLTDTEINQADRQPYEQKALDFVGALVKPDIATAYADMSSDAKQKTTQQQLDAILKPLASPLAGLADQHVAHTYFLTSVAMGANQRLPCTTVAGGSISTPEGEVIVTALPTAAQAHVIVEGSTSTGTWAFVLWIVAEETEPRVEGFWIAATSMAGKSADDLWNMAREQRARNHVFNAALLYSGALGLSYRGPDLTLGTSQAIGKEMAELNLPLELRGPPPFEWQFGPETFKVEGLRPIGVGDKLDLIIRHELDTFTDDAAADVANHELLSGFTKAFPEYADVFDAVVAEAVDAHGSRGFRTVQQASPKSN